MKGHLVVMTKAPRMGRVKSRLAQGIGHVRAWAFHRQCLSATLRKLHDPRWQCWLAVTPDRATDDLRFAGWRTVKQGGGDLGARMLKPMRDLPPGPVVVVGADIPAITPAHIAAAFRALGRHDFVFGPATDGGYWLVGAKRRPHLIDPFTNVRWSTAFALQDTLANLPKGTRSALVDRLSDVDAVDDYQKLQPRSSRAV